MPDRNSSGVDRVEARARELIVSAIEEQRLFLDKDATGAAPLLPILHALQREFGFVGEELVPVIAASLNISRAEVRGVISFYHDYRTKPGGKKTFKICRAEACQAMGCETIAQHIAAKYGLHPGETTSDGKITLENVYCLGNCALGPAALLDDELIGRLDELRVDALISGA